MVSTHAGLAAERQKHDCVLVAVLRLGLWEVIMMILNIQ